MQLPGRSARRVEEARVRSSHRRSLPRLRPVHRTQIDIEILDPSASRALERPMKENSIRRAVREGRAALGTGLKEFASRGIPWIIEASGFDYCTIDHEHGAFDMETIANMASWFQVTNVSAIVRLHKSFAHLIPVILDQGIMR